MNGTRVPELLDNGGLIARRMLQLPDRDEDMGAMLLRHLLWRVHEQVGDGTATTCILFQSVFEQGLKYLAAGGDPAALRRALQAGLNAILNELTCMTRRVDSESQLVDVARTVCGDAALARTLGEIFSVIGEHGHIEMRSGQSGGVDWDILEGALWESPILSRRMLADEARRRTDLEQCLVLCSDLEIDNPRDLIPVIEMARQDGARGLVLVASKLSAGCVAMLLGNSDPSTFQVVAVRTPEASPVDQAAALDDLEALTGGRALRMAAGDSLSRVRIEHLGRARRAWADRQYFGIIGGTGDPRRLRSHVTTLRTSYQCADDPESRTHLSRRIGRLLGASAVLWVGASTVPAIDARKDLAKRTCAALRSVLRTGVMPGGGTALLACRPRLENLLASATTPDERAAYRILLRALEEPARTIAENAGYDPGAVLARIERAGPGYGWDVLAGQLVDVERIGVLDSAEAVMTAVSSAIRSASQALTIDVLVHHRKPEESINP